MWEDPKEIETSDIDALLRFLPVFEEEGFSFGAYREPTRGEDGTLHISFPLYELSDEASAFVGACYGHGWVAPFAWGAWQDEAERLFESPEALNEADIETIRKLLTLHVRKERFCDGHLAHMHESGHLTSILRRLRDLRESLD